MFTYEEAIRHINRLGKYSAHPGIENASRLLALLGHPEEALCCVHVAGTNGKGSVCAFLSDIMTANGCRTGLFISPHLVDIRERIQIDRESIDRESFAMYFTRVENAVTQLSCEGYTGITYFDYLFAIAMCYFADRHTDLVIVETGLGGRLDSTNAIAKPKLCIITSVSHDHTEVLGDTLSKIASEKAGIIKPGVPFLYCADEPEVCRVLTRTATALHSDCFGVSRADCHRESDTSCNAIHFSYTPSPVRHTQDNALSAAFASLTFPLQLTVGSPAIYQMENAAIAFLAAWYLLSSRTPASGMDKRLLLCTRALSEAFWEGRFEEFAPGMYLDGAHNADGIRMLLESMRLVAKGRPVTLLFTAVKEKDTHEMIRELCTCGLFRRYLLTTIEGPRAISPEALREQFAQYTDAPVFTFSSPEEALEFYTSGQKETPDEILLIAGSLYLVGLIKELHANTRSHKNSDDTAHTPVTAQ